jgi:hypothetical protein
LEIELKSVTTATTIVDTPNEIMRQHKMKMDRDKSKESSRITREYKKETGENNMVGRK